MDDVDKRSPHFFKTGNFKETINGIINKNDIVNLSRKVKDTLDKISEFELERAKGNENPLDFRKKPASR